MATGELRCPLGLYAQSFKGQAPRPIGMTSAGLSRFPEVADADGWLDPGRLDALLDRAEDHDRFLAALHAATIATRIRTGPAGAR